MLQILIIWYFTVSRKLFLNFLQFLVLFWFTLLKYLGLFFNNYTSHEIILPTYLLWLNLCLFLVRLVFLINFNHNSRWLLLWFIQLRLVKVHMALIILVNLFLNPIPKFIHLIFMRTLFVAFILLFLFLQEFLIFI